MPTESEHPLPEETQPSAWEFAFWEALPHGIVEAIHLPVSVEAPPNHVLQRLHPKERAWCTRLRGRRLMEWTGGRLALQLALKRLRTRRQPFLSHDSGCIKLPKDLSASVSHKRDLVVGMVGQRSAGSLGIDLECLEPARPHLAPRILTPDELGAWQSLDADRQWPALLCVFSIKESFYKAVYPFVERFVGFHEARVELGPNGSALVLPNLAAGEGPFEIEAHYHWLGRHLLTSVRLVQG